MTYQCQSWNGSLGLSAPEPEIFTAKVKARILGWRKEKWREGGQMWEDFTKEAMEKQN